MTCTQTRHVYIEIRARTGTQNPHSLNRVDGSERVPNGLQTSHSDYGKVLAF